MKPANEALIRKAKSEDLPSILDLVRELALYERAPKEVTATMEMYRTSFAEGTFEALVAEIDGEIVGLALYYKGFSTWKGPMMYLEDFIITRKHRRRNIGTQLFEAFLEESAKAKVVLTKWQVLDWNEPAIRFYKKYQCLFDGDWLNVKLNMPQQD